MAPSSCTVVLLEIWIDVALSCRLLFTAPAGKMTCNRALDCVCATFLSNIDFRKHLLIKDSEMQRSEGISCGAGESFGNAIDRAMRELLEEAGKRGDNTAASGMPEEPPHDAEGLANSAALPNSSGTQQLSPGTLLAWQNASPKTKAGLQRHLHGHKTEIALTDGTAQISKFEVGLVEADRNRISAAHLISSE